MKQAATAIVYGVFAASCASTRERSPETGVVLRTPQSEVVVTAPAPMVSSEARPAGVSAGSQEFSVMEWTGTGARLKVTFIEGTIALTKVPAQRYIKEITFNERAVYPPNCLTVPSRARDLCTRKHHDLEEYAHGPYGPALVAKRSTENQVDLLVSAESFGSPECGTYGYWLLRADEHAVQISDPVIGCFTTPSSFYGDSSLEPNPKVRWAPTISFEVSDGMSIHLFLLNKNGLTWSSSKKRIAEL